MYHVTKLLNHPVHVKTKLTRYPCSVYSAPDKVCSRLITCFFGYLQTRTLANFKFKYRPDFTSYYSRVSVSFVMLSRSFFKK